MLSSLVAQRTHLGMRVRFSQASITREVGHTP
jgi:hypothetical protein